MGRLSKERWQALSPYLDKAFEISGAELEVWRESLRAKDGALARELDALLVLDEAIRREGFLEQSPAPPSPVAAAGQTVGAYRLEAPLGQGGTGSVWLARRSDERFVGRAALKLLHSGIVGPVGQERFKREGRILGQLQHPHIAHLIDAGVSESGQPYLALEYVDGERIDRYCDEKRLGVQDRVRLFLDVLAAVAHAHANLIVHRDIKPSNVLVAKNGSVKLVDFGIAKLIGSETESGRHTVLTRDGAQALTPEYAAPEQLTGGAVTTATDVYGLGVLLYLLLSGRHPAGGARSTAALVQAIVVAEPAPLSATTSGDRLPASEAGQEQAAANRGLTPAGLRRALRSDLETIVAKALKKKPQERYASVTALADDLRRSLEHQPISARPDTLGYRVARFLRRHRLAMGLTTATLLALLAGLAGTLWQAREARRQRDLALAQLVRSSGVNEFISFLLGDGMPLDRPTTVRQLLELTERYVDKRFAANEPLAVELLTLIGNVYDAREEMDNAERTTKRAYEASLHLGDPAVRATAACERALVVARQGRDSEAGPLFEEGLRQLSDEPRFDAIAATCLASRASRAAVDGQHDVAVRTARSALDRLRANPEAYPIHRALALEAIGLAHHWRGDETSAERAFAAAGQERERAGLTDRSLGYANLLHAWAAVRAGSNPREALAMQQRANESSRGPSGSDGRPTISGLILEGAYLYDLARYDEARAAYQDAQDLAERHRVPFFVAVARLGVAAAHRGAGDLARAREALRESEAAVAAQPPEDLLHAYLSLEQGRLALAQGELASARQRLLESLRTYEKVGRTRRSRIDALLALSELALHSGRTAEAEAHARAALAQAELLRGTSPHSGWSGRSQLALGGVYAARGDLAAARRLLTEAVAHMTETLGEGHPATRQAKSWLARHPPGSNG